MSGDDLDRVAALEREAHSHPWPVEQFRRELLLPFARIDLLWLGSELAGYLCSWLLAGEIEIQNVATSPRFRRRGVASALIRHVLRRARGEGAERALLEVRAGNDGAIALYRAFGFRTAGCRRRYYPDGEDALLMELALAASPNNEDALPG